ncbi:MAG: four helix bundle protein [Verrucomicrobia bacterium]|nr:four helix bundle protein [Verrucomicrobiota bacterium]MDA1067084.1 four helix bundle protein [Verrucomicrobiota bacterium]
MQTYRDLIVWQKSLVLVTSVYQATKDFPSTEIYGLTSQIRRSAVSIPSNIAEGYGRKSNKDFIRFLQISKGSLFELQTQWEISSNLRYLEKGVLNVFNASTLEIEKMLSSLISKIRTNSDNAN